MVHHYTFFFSMYVCLARGRSNTQSIDNILARGKKFHLAKKIFKA